MPPVDGALLLVKAEVDAADPVPPLDPGVGIIGAAVAPTAPTACVAVPLATCADRAVSAATIALKVIANLVASALRNGTTQIFPLEVPGVSSLATKARICLIFSELELRNNKELLRASAITMVLLPASAPAKPVSRTLLSIAATSMAMA